MEKHKIICIFGDSIVWGACDSEKGGWVERLKIDLAEKSEYNTIIYNLGISGETTQELINRLNTEAKARNPDTIIFSIGINDSHRPINLEVFEKNLQELIKKANKFTKKIIFLGLNTVDESCQEVINKNYFNETIEKYDNIIKISCEKNKLNYIPLKNKIGIDDLDDGLHPNSEGHEKIFEKVREFLIKNKLI